MIKKTINTTPRSLLLIVLLVFLCLLSACNGTKYVDDNELLLTHNTITSTSPTVNVSSYDAYIIQKPNTKWFSTLKVPLGIYSLSGRDTTKHINRLLRKWGEAPVILDTAKTSASILNIQNMMANEGFLDADVTVTEEIKNKRVKLNYIVTPNSPYYIRNVSYNILDHNIDSLLQQNNILSSSSIQQNKLFSVNNLQTERKGIAQYLNHLGYRYFNKEAITFVVDSNREQHIVDIAMNIGLFRRSSNEKLHEHPMFHIRNITYEAPNNKKLKLRKKTLENNTAFSVGDLYDDRKVQKTYSRFARLGTVKSTNISFTEVEDSDTIYTNNLLDARVLISQQKNHQIQVQPEGTNTAGDFGAALSLTYDNRNVFHGGETFSLQARGAYEAIKGLEGYSNNDYEEYGVEAKLSFPSLIIPGVTSSYQRRHTTTTDFLISYNRQKRPEFHRRVLTGTWRYRWGGTHGRVGHQLDAIDINYISMPWISGTFKTDYLDSNDSRNAILRYNYQDLLIMKIGYGLTYTDSQHKLSQNSLKFNIETAGNILSAVSHIANLSKNEDGQYEIARVAFAQYVKADVDYTHIFKFDTRNSLVLHSRIGVGVPYSNSSMLPYEKRYVSGGANSVRGWSVRELGPGCYKGTDGRIDFINQTGDIKLDLNAELRSDLFWKFQGAMFIDGGNIWTIRSYDDQPGGVFTFNSFYKEIAVAYGIGLRLNFDYFILRLDLGLKAISPSYTNNKEHFPIAHFNFKNDYALHFAVGLPF